MVVGNVFVVAGPYVLKEAIDALTTDLRRDLIVRYSLLIVGVAILGGVARYGMRELLNGISRRMETDIRARLFDHLMTLPPEFFDRWRTGDLMSRATNDVQAVRMVAGPAIMYAVNTVAVSSFALALMIWIDPRLTLLAMIPMVLLPPAVILFGRQIHQRFERIQPSSRTSRASSRRTFPGFRIVKAYAREGHQAERFEILNDEYKSRNLALARVWGAFHPSLIFLTGVGGVIVLWYGGGQVIRGVITIGEFVAFSFYLTQLMWPMIALGWVTNLFQRGAASMARLNELFEVEPAIRDPELPVRMPPIAGAIEFEDVSFTYPGSETPVLEGVSFRVEPGDTVAIVGATASGKTTLTRLIPRLYDATEGTVRIDGVDVRHMDLATLRDAIAAVPQDSFLFSMRLRRNIELTSGPSESGEMSETLARAIDVSQLRRTLRVLRRGSTRRSENGASTSRVVRSRGPRWPVRYTATLPC